MRAMKLLAGALVGSKRGRTRFNPFGQRAGACARTQRGRQSPATPVLSPFAFFLGQLAGKKIADSCCHPAKTCDTSRTCKIASPFQGMVNLQVNIVQ
jgi:hypothetical protein